MVAAVALIEARVVGAAAAMAGVAGMGRATGVEVEAVRTVIFGDSVWIRCFRGIQCFPGSEMLVCAVGKGGQEVKEEE